MRKTLSPEQQAKRAERKAKLAAIIQRIADMSEEERAAMSARMQVTNVDGHTLSRRNQLLIALQLGSHCTIVGGFKQWLKQGRCVRKGQHGATILFPRSFGEKSSLTNTDAASEQAATAEAGKKSNTRFLSGTVFDISQTDEITDKKQLEELRKVSALFIPPKPSLMNHPPPGGWTEADKVHKGPTPQVPALAGMSPLGMTAQDVKEHNARAIESYSDAQTPPAVVQVTPEQFGTPAATAAALTIWNSNGTEGPALICAPPPAPPPPPSAAELDAAMTELSTAPQGTKIQLSNGSHLSVWPEKLADAREVTSTTPKHNAEQFELL